MKSVLSTLAFVVFLALSSTVLWAGGADPVLGTWKLNIAKSTGPALPKSETRTYAASPEGVKLTYTRVGADGKESSVHVTYKYDGKDYPVTGSPDFDTLSVRRITANMVEGVQKRTGKPVGTTRRTVSKDGKTLTLATRSADAKGHVTAMTLVFDRQ